MGRQGAVGGAGLAPGTTTTDDRSKDLRVKGVKVIEVKELLVVAARSARGNATTSCT